MSSNRPKSISITSPGFLRESVKRVKLILALMGDSRVSFFLKLIPVAAVAYAIWPLDIPTPIDDAAVLWLGAYLFVELCPPNVVQEHMERLKQQGSQPNWDKPNAPKGEVVDGEFSEVDSR